MSYTVLARRYRSNTFDEVVGQDHVSQTLKKAIESDRIAHAYLFCGTRGTGKTSTARIMAKALNCRKFDKPTTKPCGQCESCKAIARGEDMDVIEIDAASNTQVEKVRDLIDSARLSPAYSRFKVYIIDEVHMLSKASFNALLKTLEEPPSHVKFILATTEAEKLLPTILSRCQRYDFRNIPTREIAEHLKNICKDEKIKADEEALLLVAKAGAGSMRDSLSLLDRLLSVGEKHITVELIEQTLGMPRSQAIFDLAQHIGEGDVKKLLEGVEKLVTSGLSVDTLISSLADHFRNLLIVRTCGPKSELVEAPGVSMDEMVKQAGRYEPTSLTQDIAILEELRRSLRFSQSARALLDATLVRLALAEQFTSVEDLIARADGAPAPAQKKKPELIQQASIKPQIVEEPVIPPASSSSTDDDDDDLPAPGKVWENTGPSLSELLKQQSKAASPKAPVSANVEPVNTHDLNEVLNRLMGALEAKAPSLPGYLEGAKLVGISGGQAILRYSHDHAPMATMLERNGKKETIRVALGTLLQQEVGLKIECDDEPAEAPVETPVARAPQRPVMRQTAPAPVQAPAPVAQRITDEMRQELAKDELIKAVLDNLGGEIVKVE